MSTRPTLTLGYQAVAFGPEVRDYSSIFHSLDEAKEFIFERGAYYDAFWVIIGPNAFYNHDGTSVSWSLHRVLRDALVATYQSNMTTLTVSFPLNYVMDGNPLPTEQKGGVQAVLIQYPLFSPGAELIRSVWCATKIEAAKVLRGFPMNTDQPGYIFKALVAGPEEIYDQDGEPAGRELYESVKGIYCHRAASEGTGYSAAFHH